MCLPGTAETVREQHNRMSRRGVLAGGGAAALAALAPAAPAMAQRKKPKGKVVDLTHRFIADFPVYTPPAPARRTIKTFAANGFYSQEWTFGEHSGTHVDAPGHFVEGRRLVDQLKPRELVVPLVVIDIADRAAGDPDTEVTPDDIRRFERRHGRVPRGALVAMRSGWAAKLGSPEFTGQDASGTFHFPGFGLEAAELLLDRRAGAIGVDTLSLDPGPSKTFAVHSTWLGTDRYGVEGLANLGRVPVSGAVATVGVIPWQSGSGGPARVLASY